MIFACLSWTFSIFFNEDHNGTFLILDSLIVCQDWLIPVLYLPLLLSNKSIYVHRCSVILDH